MDSGIRASAFAGLGALFLSIIISTFSGAPFGVILLRAILSGVGFSILVFIAIKTTSRFIPELFDDSSAQASWAKDNASGIASSNVLGSRVDIVLSEEDDQEEPELLEAVSDGYKENTDNIVADDELKREVQSLVSNPVLTEESDEETVMPRPSVALDELDSLPDLDGFSDSFASLNPDGSENIDPDNRRDGNESDYSRLAGPSSSMPSSGNPNAGQDPAVLAKAVQTLMRRDQKGQ